VASLPDLVKNRVCFMKVRTCCYSPEAAVCAAAPEFVGPDHHDSSVNVLSCVVRALDVACFCSSTHALHLGRVSAAHFEKQEAKSPDLADRFHGSFVYPI
jgi:hypothetical protein